MARPTILFVLAILALAMFSAQAIKPPHRNHAPAAPPPLTSKRHRHHALPHRNKHAHNKHTHHAAAPSPVDGNAALPPEPYPDFYAFAGRCLRKLTAECGREIFKGIFGDKAAVSNSCCLELVAMGRRCHRGIVKATLALPELPKREKKEIKRRDARVWSQCVFVSDALKNWNNSSLLPPSV
ncbi:hypothetical protein CDL12_06674 [Handroanthus impetiginosus]|uniref:Prolamin-like domain-containing protein n=1 Tax=Handroanthus impetiginosus TaxID=429701 RepID=A0A2G9HSY9_9LAMI|nr:hypothetical protein CDL12_06674 [Handroanthus impetiginosus]